ncbi:tetratricopeptide repeat protein [Actinoplanes palleronii]|uniref:Tetratricopeptide repeat protein n=1 Tax=Actinoplanes palleronii TaxID=113570 RepID=A0ABQ4BIE3_9ACTN|nr:tetratricopeptide repeat protein [Actinoplanes palleronii]GIE70456.1 hypothetical protein Apa02nite_065640 [Actinoplanes palleronii]
MAEVYRSAHAGASIAVSENDRGEMLRRAGRPGAAEEHFARALEALGTVTEPDPGTHSAILNNLALTAHEQGDLARAKRCLVRSLEVGPLVGDPIGRAITFDNLGVIEVELARLAELPATTARPPSGVWLQPGARPTTPPLPDTRPGDVGRAAPGGQPEPASPELDTQPLSDARPEPGRSTGTGTPPEASAQPQRSTLPDADGEPDSDGRRESDGEPAPDDGPEGTSAADCQLESGPAAFGGRHDSGDGAGIDVGLGAAVGRPSRSPVPETPVRVVPAARARPGSLAAVHLNEAETHFAVAERLFRTVLPDGVDDYLRSVLNRADATELRGDVERTDRLTRHAAELAAHPGITPDNALEAVTMRGGFLHRHRDDPLAAVDLMTARLPALLPDCPPERSATALTVLLRAAAATGDPALVDDVTTRITELAATSRRRDGEHDRRTGSHDGRDGDGRGAAGKRAGAKSTRPAGTAARR